MEHRLTSSIEAEQSVLGGIMLSNGKALAEVQDIITVNDFYRANHRVIYGALCELDAKDSPVDVVTVSEQMNSGNLLKECGGIAYLGTLVKDTASIANIRTYAQIIRDRAIRRELVVAAQTIKDLTEEVGDIETILGKAHSVVLEIGNDEGGAGPKELSHWIPGWMDRLDQMSQSDELVAGITTGFTDLDRKINGLQKQNLIVIAGRPAMGKTAMATNIVHWIVTEKQKPALVFSLEMSGDEVLTRMVSQHGRVPMERLMSGDMDTEHWQKVSSSLSRLKEIHHLRIDEAASLMLSQIRARARRARAKMGDLGLIVVDYLQLMMEEGKSDTRAGQIAEMTRGLKALAKEMDVPVVILSQLNREVEKRENRHPRLADLKESGSIEQDADVVIFIYRDVVYNENTMHPTIAEIMVAKQRNGPTGTVLLNYFGEYTQFANIDIDSQQAFWESRHSSRTKKRRGYGDDEEF